MKLWRPWGTTRPENRLDRSAAMFDAFGRLRVSNPDTVFDSKLSYGKLSVFWDEVVSGAGASATHVEVDSCVRMQVSSAGEYVIRQTRQRWNYQPGKSQMILMTFRVPDVAGVVSRVGPMHGNYAAPHAVHDGLYFELENRVAYCCITKGTESGGIVSTTRVAQSAWNMDRLDGTGPSGKVVDWSKAQIMQIDYQWLGLGSVRFGFEVDSVMVYVHEFSHAGLVDSVYMHNGTQPLRYEIRSTGGFASMDHICSTVISEGGQIKTGVTVCEDTNGILISCPAATIEMLLAVRLNPASPDAQILLESIYTLNTAANTSFRWVLLWNPVITGTPNWVTSQGSPVQVWKNLGTAITMTGGLPLSSGYASKDSRQTNQSVAPSIGPGVGIAGTADVVALGIESIGGTSTCAGGIGLRQLV